LVVAHDATLRRMLSVALREEGFHTLHARDDVEAIDVFEWARIAAVVLDVTASGSEGVALRQAMLAQPGASGIPVVVLSRAAVCADHLDPTCVLRQPVSAGDVVAAVIACIDAAEGPA
jgi:DNA-binding response OmpR family regulator